MKFQVVSGNSEIKSVEGKPCVFLYEDAWDDWFEFSTLYVGWYRDEKGEKHNLGGVKIGQLNMKTGQRRPTLPDKFTQLEACFSLGQDESYYEALNALNISTDVLNGLCDVAYDLELFEKVKDEKVTGVSLLRSVTPLTVCGQFNRLAHGGARLSRFNFSYVEPQPPNDIRPVELSFQVIPNSNPPSNVHVLIGRNGVGKTRILNLMTQALVGGNDEQAEGHFEPSRKIFANLVSVTFSAFDPFEPLPVSRDRSDCIQYFYIGLKRRRRPEDANNNIPNKSHSALAKEFSESLNVCRQGARLKRWRTALQVLESDVIFKEAEVSKLAEESIEDFFEESTESGIKKRALSLFSKLSSGHKIVLLTVTRLVETVEEKTLVLIDEPEAHLHPPLLSAFIRSLSELLKNRNGVAIIATHSPVILQEVPSHCVWKVRRSNYVVKAERPQLETFGENVGILTHEVFGLEVTRSGFHDLLRTAVEEEYSFEAVLQRFDGALGSEAKAIAQALFNIKKRTRDVETR